MRFKAKISGGFIIALFLLEQSCSVPRARVVKLVDAGDSKSPAARRVGSIPTPGTTKIKALRASCSKGAQRHSHDTLFEFGSVAQPCLASTFCLKVLLRSGACDHAQCDTALLLPKRAFERRLAPT